jgi:hypothetical protein
MKIYLQKSNREQGSVLFVSLAICAILGILIGSYLYLIRTQRFTVARAQCWENALVVAETGVEEAMAHLNSGIPTNSFGTNSWTDLGGGTYAKTNYLGSNSWYVTIQTSPVVTNTYPVITSTAYVPGPVSSPALSRTVRVNTKAKPPINMPNGMVISSTIDFSGQGIATDSFDSSDPNYSTAGQYDPLKAKDNGDVTTLSTNANAFGISNGKVKGIVHTPPGGVQDVTATVGSNGSVGDNAWVNGGNTGFENNRFAADANVTIGDVTLPPEMLTAPFANSGKYKINGFNYKYQLDGSSPIWQLSSLGSSLYVTGSNVLYISGDLIIGSGAQIYVDANSSLTIYVAGNVNVGGNGVVNYGGLAQNFTLYGLPTDTAVDFNSNANFCGSIYAPEAYFSLGGGGSSTYNFVGKAVAQTLKMNGHFNFHFDEALKESQRATGYVAASWDEL